MMDMGHLGEAVWMLRDIGLGEEFIANMQRAAMPEVGVKTSLFGSLLNRLRAYNHARRDAGKISVNGYRVIELLRKVSFGVLD